jgi:hypothetical protein
MTLTPDWRKATYSFSNSNCVEARWRKSSHSEAGNCAEAALRGGTVLVRDSKDKHGPVLAFAPADWQQFLEGVKAS